MRDQRYIVEKHIKMRDSFLKRAITKETEQSIFLNLSCFPSVYTYVWEPYCDFLNYIDYACLLYTSDAADEHRDV